MKYFGTRFFESSIKRVFFLGAFRIIALNFDLGFLRTRERPECLKVIGR